MDKVIVFGKRYGKYIIGGVAAVATAAVAYVAAKKSGQTDSEYVEVEETADPTEIVE